MKANLIKTNLTTRKKIDQVAKLLNLSAIGSRQEVLNRIEKSSYSQIKKAIHETS